MIGIISAMQPEMQELLAAMKNTAIRSVGGSVFYRGTLCGAECVLTRSGVGKVAAAVAAQTMILMYAPDLIVNTGVGGALTEGVHPGDIVVSSRAVQYDVDTTALGDAPGLISGVNRVYFEADATAAQLFLDCAAACGLRARPGTVATGDRFVADAGQKEHIVRLFDATVCEMEGGAVAQTAFRSDTPFVIVRAVSDNADGSSDMDYATFLPLAAKNSTALVCAFLRRVAAAHPPRG